MGTGGGRDFSMRVHGQSAEPSQVNFLVAGAELCAAAILDFLIVRKAIAVRLATENFASSISWGKSGGRK